MLRVRNVLLVIIVAAATVGALLPTIPGGWADYDWLFHIIIFALMVVVASSLARSFLAPMIVAAVAIGVGLEIAQIWVPSRTFSLQDIGFDLVGILIGTGATLGLRECFAVGEGRLIREPLSAGSEDIRRGSPSTVTTDIPRP